MFGLQVLERLAGDVVALKAHRQRVKELLCRADQRLGATHVLQ
ncbi:MAG: hypothetical protein ACRDLR_03965 [Gaiellaceae bacterium]